MDTTSSSGAAAGALSQFTAVQAEVNNFIITGKLGIDQVAEILYEPGTDARGHFFISSHVVAPITPAPLYRELTTEEMQSLLTTLRAEEHNPPAGLDVTLLRTFVHLLSQAVEHQPSNRFNYVRFGDIVQDPGGAIVGHLGLGVDVVGTIHDAHSVITFEQHIVPMHPRPFRHLSAADRASLTAALDKYIGAAQPRANPLWDQVSEDLKK